jgi:hypothetical protein
MSEKELIELGFEKVEIPSSESGNGFDYYFYSRQFCDDITLYSTDSIDVKDDEWELKCYEISSIRISDVDVFNQFIEVLDNIICE